ncbi:MAG: DUF1254 domain-containing protein [Proteobacteria bacterium]|nr:DUF1254 domain-containing protein [Pseudomonadota bacterium]
MMSILLAASAMALPTPEQCQAAALDPEAVLAQAVGLQGFIYGYPIVDMLKQQHAETHRVRPGQPVAAPVNTIAVYPGVLTPATQGELRAANSDTLYLNAWIDLSKGPVLLEVPDMAGRYYTLAFMDLYSKPHHLGTRTNGGKAARYALVGPSGGKVPKGYTPFPLPTDTAWMLGRVMVADPKDEAEAIRVSHAMAMKGERGPEVTDAAPLQPFNSLAYFVMLNRALRTLPAVPGEEALMASFDAAGFGPNASFDPAKLTPGQALGLGCAVKIGPQVISQRGFKPTQTTNGWLLSSAIADPGRNFLLRAEIARGGYVNEPRESIYPAAIADSSGQMLIGANRYRIRFAADAMPPVNAFWSITAYDSKTAQLTENPLRRYAIGDRTKGLRYGRDGSLEIVLSATPPPEGTENWLPVPAGAFHLVTRMYLPRAEALDGRYALPVVERIP